MKNADLWKQHEDYTKDTSTIARQLAFGATAISWLFKNPDTSSPTPLFPESILYAILSIVVFFFSDFLQYLTSALLLRFWIRAQEKRKWNEQQTIEGEYIKPAWLDYPAFTFWVLKIIFLIIAYIYIGCHLVKSI